MIEILVANVVFGLCKAAVEGLAIGAGIGFMLAKVKK